tara:strand:+ start:306 stop:536 length:231 start_codon:yes stop_codon:yes gene_type:complete
VNLNLITPESAVWREVKMNETRRCIGNLNTDILLICNPIVLHDYRDREIAALEAVMDDFRRPDIIMNYKIARKPRV